MTDQSQPLRDQLNRSGVPFQLAVENLIRREAGKTEVEVVGREIPWSRGFIDIVAKKGDRMFFAIECKKVEDKSWSFLLPDSMRDSETRCRLEWFNGRASKRPDQSRVFCSEWNMAEPSPESEFCIVPKNTPISSLEAVCSELLASCHDLLENDDKIFLDHEFATMIPVIVTNANLYTCKFKADQISLRTGELDIKDGEFESVDIIRFRKSLVNLPSNPYNTSQMVLSNWTADRQRTVFLITPSATVRFFGGFRSFTSANWGGAPEAFLNPPS
ncbi:MAG: hypothetical protein R3B11_00010 [Nitrospira sp.]|nr:hypothetical protein [Nitrospira sp.]